jgi:outer membrane protein assembly factor BamB
MHDPLAVKDLVVVGTDKGALRAYRAGTGEFAWEYNCGKRIFHHPSSDGERIYFTVDSSLTAVTADAGIKVWDFDMRESRCWSRSH